MKRARISTIVTAGLIGLPLLLAMGCNDSAFENEASAADQNEYEVAATVDTRASDEESAPLKDCAKAGSGKVLVCHVPGGNELAKHTLCVSETGAVNGHGLNLNDVYAVGAHGGDKLGACDDELPDNGCPEGGC